MGLLGLLTEDDIDSTFSRETFKVTEEGVISTEEDGEVDLLIIGVNADVRLGRAVETGGGCRPIT